MRTLIAVAVVCSIAVLTARQSSIRAESTSVQAGQSAVVIVAAPAGTAVTVTASGPGAPIVPQRIVSTGGEQRVTIGPMTQSGEYVITATAGAAPIGTARVRAAVPAGDTAPAASGGSLQQAYENAGQSLVDSINALRTGVSRLPQSDPTIAQVKSEIDQLEAQLRDIRARATEIGKTFDDYERLLGQESNASREARDEFTRLHNELTQVLNEQARQMAQLARDAGEAPDDPCVAAMAVSAAMRGQSAVAAAMRQGAADFGTRQRVSAGGDGADWARANVTAGRPLRGEGTAQSSAAAWRAMKPKVDALVASGAARNYAEAERMVNDMTGDRGLGRYSEQQCLLFKGDWSGSTSVSALDKNQPFYTLQNDWTAHVELAAARTPGGGSGDAPVRGTLTGRGTRFKVVNQLRSLYEGRPATHMEFLTSDPTPAQIASANFVMSIEGTIRNNQMTLKLRPGGMDYAGRVTGKMAAVVIPMASPVPLVQTYDVVFQGGTWQLMRAFGPNGVAERPFPITVANGKRIVQAEYPRTLTASGARGEFTIRFRMCAGCE